MPSSCTPLNFPPLLLPAPPPGPDELYEFCLQSPKIECLSGPFPLPLLFSRRSSPRLLKSRIVSHRLMDFPLDSSFSLQLAKSQAFNPLPDLSVNPPLGNCADIPSFRDRSVGQTEFHRVPIKRSFFVEDARMPDFDRFAKRFDVRTHSPFHGHRAPCDLHLGMVGAYTRVRTQQLS